MYTVHALLCLVVVWRRLINTSRPRQNGRYFADDILERIFFNEVNKASIKISMEFVRKDPIYNKWVLVQMMAWLRAGSNPLFEPTMVSMTNAYMRRWYLMS